jgi:hypothetical protein
VIDRLSDQQPFVPEGPALGERAQLGMAPGEHGTGGHGRQGGSKALVVLHPIEIRSGLPTAVDRPPIVTLGVVDLAKVLVRQRMHDAIAASCGERESALASGDGLVIRAHEAEMDR